MSLVFLEYAPFEIISRVTSPSLGICRIFLAKLILQPFISFPPKKLALVGSKV